MNFSAFFIRRPRFAIVISLVMVLLGLMAIVVLPVAQYPDITPPQIIVEANYPGASAAVLVDTVAVPIENQLNGVEGMLYMESTADDNGSYQLTITFNIGTDPDIAQVKVENRLQQVMSELPDVVNKEGLSVRTQSSNLLAMIVLRSPNNSYSDLYLSNYAYTNLKSPLERVSGVSQVQIYGPQNSMRVWLNPQKMASLNVSAEDVVSLIESQNIQAAVGSIGSAPSPKGSEVVLSLTAKGLLNTVKDFEDIIITTSKGGGVVRLKDIGRVEIGADSYALAASYDNAPAVILGFSQTPSSNALDIMKALKKEMARLQTTFPEDMEFKVAYDSTTFVRASIESIIETLFTTFALVVLVVFVFLQDPKSTLIPMITIPVSLIATFAVIYLMGFNLNILTLFAMILAIGLVVDDAIIVVERAQYLMQNENKNALDASVIAMQQIGSAIIATTFVLLSIFVPVALMAGITGKIYQQFAVTIATAVVFSAINALTLSPALCAIFLEHQQKATEQDEPNKQGKSYAQKSKLEKVFAPFNRALDWAKEKYLSIVGFLCRQLALMSACVIGAILIIGAMFFILPQAFVPSEDQGFILGNVQLPQTASINQTQALTEQMSAEILKMDGIKYVITVAGASMLGGDGENIALLAIGLNDWDQRTVKDLSLSAIVDKLMARYGSSSEAAIDFYSMPSIPGVGSSDGLSYDVIAQDLNMTSDAFDQMLASFLAKVNQSSDFQYAFSTYRAGTPHLFLDVDRTKLKSYNIPVSNLFETLQNNLGSRYVNNITMSGQVNKVIIQADYDYRKSIENVLDLYAFSSSGVPVQVRNFASVHTVLSPKIIYRHNQYTAASVISAASAGVSSGTAINATQSIASQTLSKSQGALAWTGLSLQEVETRGLAVILIALAVVFGYLFLVALYESWLVALAVMFSNVFAILGALAGLYLMGLPLSIYAQLGLVLLIGLASKNAILIVEFTLDYRKQGMDVITASVKGAAERFRAVLMTALTFILGVFPMVIATGAGAANQRAIGTAVFFGMIFATLVGILFIPALFALFDTFASHFAKPQQQGESQR